MIYYQTDPDFTNNVDEAMFRKVADAILISGRFNLQHWAKDISKPFLHSYDVDLVDNCSTVGCVAGWAIAITDGPKAIQALQTQPAIVQRGATIMGMTIRQADRLFFAHRGSIWTELADHYGWDLDNVGDMNDWSLITAEQAHEVLTLIADNRIAL